ncbi:tensin-3-like [Phyllostomus discolor]|uniref:Tensin-3-like n=1 Tax=Phyllostomus discolor TaxID=89673 RepID=A0A7E6CH86_9CHIR|nr:tensin-3-like [Phyllostomus discolor]
MAAPGCLLARSPRQGRDLGPRPRAPPRRFPSLPGGGLSSHPGHGDAEEVPWPPAGHGATGASPWPGATSLPHTDLGRSLPTPAPGRGRLPSTRQRRCVSRRRADARPCPAACNVWYLGSVDTESLTGHQAVQKALSLALAQQPPPLSTVVHFKVSSQGITLTDNQRKLFFRKHYPVSTVIFCALDPQGRKWVADGVGSRAFGFVARKQGSTSDNECHLFAEHDPEQPASAIVNFVSKVMIGSPKKM